MISISRFRSTSILCFSRVTAGNNFLLTKTRFFSQNGRKRSEIEQHASSSTVNQEDAVVLMNRRGWFSHLVSHNEVNSSSKTSNSSDLKQTETQLVLVDRENAGVFVKFQEWMRQERLVVSSKEEKLDSTGRNLDDQWIKRFKEWTGGKEDGLLVNPLGKLYEFMTGYTPPEWLYPTLFNGVLASLLTKAIWESTKATLTKMPKRLAAKQSTQHELVKSIVKTDDGSCLQYRMMMNGMSIEHISIRIDEICNRMLVTGSKFDDERKYRYEINLPDGNFAKAEKKVTLVNGDLYIVFAKYEEDIEP